MSQPLPQDSSGAPFVQQSPPVPNDQPPPQQQRHIIVNNSTPDPALAEIKNTLSSLGTTLAGLPEQLVHSFRESQPQPQQPHQQQNAQPQPQQPNPQASAQGQQVQQHQQQQRPRVMSERRENFLRGWFGR